MTVILTKLLMVACATLVVANDFREEDLDFLDCGSSFDIHQVNIEGCTYASCPIYLGEGTNVVINASNYDTILVSDMKTQASIIRQNAAWTIELTPEDACNDWACPLTSTTHRTFTGVVNTKSYAILGSATLDLRVIYEEEGVSEKAICVQVKVEVGKKEEVKTTTLATTEITEGTTTTEEDPGEDDTFQKMVHVYIRRNRLRKRKLI